MSPDPVKRRNSINANCPPYTNPKNNIVIRRTESFNNSLNASQGAICRMNNTVLGMNVPHAPNSTTSKSGVFHKVLVPRKMILPITTATQHQPTTATVSNILIAPSNAAPSTCIAKASTKTLANTILQRKSTLSAGTASTSTTATSINYNTSSGTLYTLTKQRKPTLSAGTASTSTTATSINYNPSSGTPYTLTKQSKPFLSAGTASTSTTATSINYNTSSGTPYTLTKQSKPLLSAGTASTSTTATSINYNPSSGTPYTLTKQSKPFLSAGTASTSTTATSINYNTSSGTPYTLTKQSKPLLSAGTASTSTTATSINYNPSSGTPYTLTKQSKPTLSAGTASTSTTATSINYNPSSGTPHTLTKQSEPTLSAGTASTSTTITTPQVNYSTLPATSIAQHISTATVSTNNNSTTTTTTTRDTDSTLHGISTSIVQHKPSTSCSLASTSIEATAHNEDVTYNISNYLQYNPETINNIPTMNLESLYGEVLLNNREFYTEEHQIYDESDDHNIIENNAIQMQVAEEIADDNGNERRNEENHDPIQLDEYAENLMGLFDQRYGRLILESLNTLNQAAAALNRQNQVAEGEELPPNMPFDNILNFTAFETNDDRSQIQLTNYLKRLGGSRNESIAVINSYWRASFTPHQTTTQSLVWTKRSDLPDRTIVRKSKFYEACKIGAEYSEIAFDYAMKLAFKAVKAGTVRRITKKNQKAAQAAQVAQAAQAAQVAQAAQAAQAQ